MLRTHERVAVAIRGGGSVNGSSAAPQQSTEVKSAESASHAERLSDPLLSSRHGLESVAEQLQSRRDTAATIARHPPSMQKSLSTAAAAGDVRRRPTGRRTCSGRGCYSVDGLEPTHAAPAVTHALDKRRRSAPGATRRPAGRRRSF